MNGPFKPEDFTLLPSLILTAQECANRANARFKELLEEAPTVYAQTYEDGSSVYGWRDSQKIHCTHTAKLICIEEIKK